MEMKDNLEILDLGWDVPADAKKPISGGRLNGKTDISPMWRIRRLTEIFGPCGIGWWYEIKSQRLEAGADHEVKAFVDVDLYYRWGEQVSKPIPGVGGNSFVEKGGKYTSDECFKMGLTDAISVAAKALGIGGSVYAGEGSKYSARREDPSTPPRSAQDDRGMAGAPAARQEAVRCSCCGNEIKPYLSTKGRTVSPQEHAARSTEKFGQVLCLGCMQNNG